MIMFLLKLHILLSLTDDSAYEEVIKPILLTEKRFSIIRNFIQKPVADAEGKLP